MEMDGKTNYNLSTPLAKKSRFCTPKGLRQRTAREISLPEQAGKQVWLRDSYFKRTVFLEN